MTKLPDSVNILGLTYSVEYVDNPADVDIWKRQSLWGQVDYWTRSIRIYRNQLPPDDMWQTLLHECLHVIAKALHLESLTNEDNHDDLDILALALADMLMRNGWLEIGSADVHHEYGEETDE
jgi:hypothetical protein